MLPIAASERPSTAEILAHDFALFTAAAGALESAYGKLQGEVVRLREQLAATRTELEREQDAARRWRALAEVARLLAHELRNPLASMELQAGLLTGSRDLGKEDRQAAGRLQAGVRFLTATLNNILHFHERAAQPVEASELGPLVRQACDFLLPLAEQARVRLHFSDRLAGARVAADPYRLQQVVLNLALNAIRAMPAGGRLRITGWRGGDGRLQVSFLDSGPGVPVELREKLFAPGVSSRPGGLGLGLAVAKRILEQHGGQIRLLPTRRGAGFLVALPSL
jgi:two-component system sensor histidine kinase FlrB